MSDDKLETTVPSTTTTTTGNDDPSKTNPLAASSPPLPTPPSPTAPMSSTKLGSLTNRILSPSDINASPISTNSSSPSHISPNKSSCHSSAATTRRTFNICDILAKPSSSSVDSNNNPRSNHSIEKPKAHRFTGHPKKIREPPTKVFNESKSHSNKKPLYSHSDDDDEDDDDDDGHHGSISDCDLSGTESLSSSCIESNACLLAPFQMDVCLKQVIRRTTTISMYPSAMAISRSHPVQVHPLLIDHRSHGEQEQRSPTNNWSHWRTNSNRHDTCRCANDST